MEGVDDVAVVEVCGRGLVGHVHGMLEGQVPYREGLELRVARLLAVTGLVVELREADRELARSGAGGRYHHERLGGLCELVLAKALVADDEVDVCGVALDGVVAVDRNA